MKILYFMHPVNIYDTPFEIRCEGIIHRRVPEYSIENPNRPWHQAGYQRYREMVGKIGMDYFMEVVLPAVAAGAFLPFRDGMVGAGIWKEADWFTERGLPLWEINVHSGTLFKVERIPDNRRLTVEETRERIRNPDGSRKPY